MIDDLIIDWGIGASENRIIIDAAIDTQIIDHRSVDDVGPRRGYSAVDCRAVSISDWPAMSWSQNSDPPLERPQGP